MSLDTLYSICCTLAYVKIFLPMALFLNKLPFYLNHFLLLIALAARRCCTFNEVAHVL